MHRRAFTLAALAQLGLGAVASGDPMHRPINPTALSYAEAHEVTNPKRLVFISGQVPEAPDGTLPTAFKDQCRMVWRNIQAQLTAADMTLDDLAKITVFLSDRRYRHEHYEVRKEVLGDRAPAMTIIITGIYDERWLLEIEAIAAT